MPRDEEKGDNDEEFVGFAGVASFIANDKEHSSSVYRRYEKLAARNLLYLQAELRELEVQLDEFDREDARGEVEEIELAMDWQALRAQAEAKRDSSSKEARRKKVIYKLRAKIKEYRKSCSLKFSSVRSQRPFLSYLRNRGRRASKRANARTEKTFTTSLPCIQRLLPQ